MPARLLHPIVVDRLNAAIGKDLGVPALRTRFRQMGVLPLPMSPERYGKFFADDMAAMIQPGNDAQIAPPH